MLHERKSSINIKSNIFKSLKSKTKYMHQSAQALLEFTHESQTCSFSRALQWM